MRTYVCFFVFQRIGGRGVHDPIVEPPGTAVSVIEARAARRLSIYRKAGSNGFCEAGRLYSIRSHRCLWKKRRTSAAVANQRILQKHARRVAV